MTIHFKTTEQIRKESLDDAIAFLKDAARQLREAIDSGNVKPGNVEYMARAIDNYKKERGII